MTSWKTTLAGIFALLGTIAAAGKLALAGDYAGAISAALAGIPVGVGLILAKDHTATPAA
jgi:hypothetical protein